MKKVFLADDEYIMVEGLRHLVDWNGYGMQVCGVAYDGATARDEILRTEPDVVFTDIRMPGLNGLDLIQILKPLLPDTLFVVISGYNDFAYIRMALRLNLVDYLDKPVTVEKIGGVLERIRQIFTAREDMSRREDENSLSGAIALLLKEEDVRTETLSRIQQSAGVNLLGVRNVSVALLLAEPGALADAQAVERALCYGLSRWNVSACACRTAGEWLVLTYAPRPCGDQPGCREAMAGVLKGFVEDGGIARIGLSGEYASLCDLGKAVGEARCAGRYAAFFDETFVGMEEMEQRRGTPARIWDGGSEIGFGLRTCAWAEVSEKVRLTVDHLAGQMLSPELFCHACLELVYLGLGICGESGMPYEEDEKPFLPHTQIAALPSSEEVARWTTDTYDRMIQWLKNRRAQTERKTVFRAKAYIDAHYEQPITLQMLADMCEMHPTYFSVMFKEQVGMPYSKYLNGVRMERAKALLKAGEKVWEASERVGFVSSRYFAGKFKNYTGMNPEQYRRMG